MNKIKGSIYGVLIGDALGTTYEFKKAKNIKLPKILNVVGKGPFHVAKGQVTDDSEMTLALAHSIIKKKKFDKEDVSKAYIRWIKSEPADNGITTARALKNAKNYKETVNNAKKYNQESLSNGFLMRISPLAIIGLNMKENKLNKIIKEEVSITHSNILCYYCAKLYIYMLIYIINGGKDYQKEALRIIDLDEHKTKDQLIEIVNTSTKTIYFKKIKPDSNFMGFMFVSLQISFYCLYNSKSYQDGMRNIIKLGGDTDTNCAISGAFLGAKFGYDKIPKKWLETVIEANYNRPEEFKLNVSKLENLFKL